MKLQEAIDKLREQGLLARQSGLDEHIFGGERLEVYDDIELIKGIVFGIHFEAGWWIADFPAFGTNPISQITDDLSIAVQSLLNVIQYDRETKDYRARIMYALADLQAARLPLLVNDYGVLEIYQPPQEPKGLVGTYGNSLSDWWIPTDSPSAPIGSLILKQDKWVVNHFGKNESVTTDTLGEAVQKALELFK